MFIKSESVAAEMLNLNTELAENKKKTVNTGLSLRAGSREFSPATTSLGPGYFDTKRKYCKEKNAANYKIMNKKTNQ